jgi:multiple sugar transport system substrate-binding protein
MCMNGIRRFAPRGSALLVAVLLASLAGCGGDAEEHPGLTIWWAKWAPSDGLAEMGRRYEAETGVPVHVHQIPWTDYQSQAFLEFGNSRTAFDIIIGDSQWIGSAVDLGIYVDLTDWIKTAVDLDSIHPVAARYLCEYPSGSGRFFAAPCETDAVGFAYRKDWFEDPAEQAAFLARYGRPLEVPETWDELRDLAEFFQRPDEKRYGVVALSGRGYDSLVMGFQQLMWAFGGAWAGDDGSPVGAVDSDATRRALGFYKGLVALGPEGGSRASYGDAVQYFMNGSTAMMMNYFAFFPDIAASEELGGKVGFFKNPTQDGRRGVSLGGQGFSVSAKTTPEKQQLAKDFIAWFQQREQQDAWISMPGCFTADTGILASRAFRDATPYNEAFAESLQDVRDFWNIPEFNDLLAPAQKHLAEVIDGKAEVDAALAAVAAEQADVLRKAGHLK